MNEDEFILEDSILDFLLYYYNRVHTTTRYSPYDIMEKRSDEITMKKVRENTLKSRKDQKIEELKKDNTVLISNKLIHPDKQKHYLNYHRPIILKKGNQKEHFKVKGK